MRPGLEKKHLRWFIGLNVLNTVFMGIPQRIEEGWPEVDFFLFSDQLLTPQAYINFLLKYAIYAFTTFFFWKETTQFVNFFRVNFLIATLNLLQFVLRYDSIYYVFPYLALTSHLITTVWLIKALNDETDA